MMNPQTVLFSRALRSFTALSLFAILVLQMAAPMTKAQDTVTGAFEGTVRSSSGEPIAGAAVQFINQLTGVPIAKRSDSQGRFYQGLLPPGNYTIRVSAQGYQTREIELRLLATRSNQVVPVPVILEPATTATATPTPTPTGSPDPTATPTPTTTTTAQAGGAGEDTNVLSDINTTDARRGGAFTDKEVSTLPLGGTTLVRTFDELALLLPGVAEAPQAIGSGTGPGVGAGVGTSGQFSVNGLRSRANNFTVDGSDNNDEDIGVRRQGFFALVPQPVESIQEYQVITLLAPAQFGRNIGAQVNAVSKSGGNETHGAFYGFFNSSQLNSRNAFDTVGSNTTFALRSGPNQNLPVLNCGFLTTAACITANPLFRVLDQRGEEDSFTLFEGGMVLGGPLMPDRMFYFLSFEKQNLNAVKESNFAVPTVEQRGLRGTGATGISFMTPGGLVRGFPTSLEGDAIFSLYPFPNNPTGVYGQNTLTQVLPASAEGLIASGKIDSNFRFWGKQHSFTARYNFTDDWRDIPVTGEALFSTLRPNVRTQNFSTFLNTELTDTLFNQLRLSYGRTHLFFEENLHPYLLRSGISPSEPFLLNAPLLINNTFPPAAGGPNTGPVIINSFGNLLTTEDRLGRVGQIRVAGFSPIGVDPFNFPQRRTNNTYQVADNLTWRKGRAVYVFGADIRRTELNSDLPRNSRTLLTFNGAPEIDFDMAGDPFFTGNFIPGIDFAAAGAPSGSFLSLGRTGSGINLRYYQLNFFGQSDWRLRPNLSLSFGVRYEYNTPPREVNERIESTFNTPLLSNPNISGLRRFIDGRSGIFDPDRNNFAPRVGVAWSPNWFGADKTTVIRAGYGLFYDQILGAVVSQSRNVFPNFVTVNTGAASFAPDFILGYFNPATGGLCYVRDPMTGDCLDFRNFVQPGTLNTLNPAIPFNDILNLLGTGGPGGADIFPTPFGVTLPARNLETPMAHHYSVTFEQQLSRNMVVSAAYVGTQGRNLLRFTTPNLGPNNVVLAFGVGVNTSNVPAFLGFPIAPNFGRPVPGIGPVSIFETTADSRYDALQLQARGRFMRRMQYQVNYTYSHTEDDVSDVFDLAGAPALPQNSDPTSAGYLAGERAPASFDARHRFAYNMIYDFPEFRERSGAFRFLFGGWQVASTGKFHTGQPFTVNSISDVNLDGNLTDRLNNTNGIQITGDRSQPLRLTTNNFASLLARVGENGSVGRNTFRAGNVLELDLSFVKNFSITERQNLTFRMDIFNFIDRENYGIPVRYLEAPGFGRATDTVTPGRRIQFALKYSF